MNHSSKPSTSRRSFLATAATIAALPTIVSARALWERKGSGRQRANHDSVSSALAIVAAMCSVPCWNYLTFNASRSPMCKASRRNAGKKNCRYKVWKLRLGLVPRLPECSKGKISMPFSLQRRPRHGPASMMAAEAGKDVYSEKPCGLTIDVCQRLAITIRKTNRIFQAGTQRRKRSQLCRSRKAGSIWQARKPAVT